MNWGLPTAWLMMKPQDVEYVPMWVLTLGTLWCDTQYYPYPYCILIPAMCSWTIFYDTIYACQVSHRRAS